MVRLRAYDVKMIRGRYQRMMLINKTDEKPRALIEDIANEYGVKPSCIYRIIKRKTWKHV
ncbi:hypothetical protein [Bacillus cereus]|uniref:hypothetical protein n=1 Tax=Bacillaceae TaxID=186817 RepID=UPI0037FA9FD6